jgi:fatty-acyl-CoA synthase/long-chain acyl-CoA synthetase
VGSVGLRFPYTDVRIVKRVEGELVECATDEIGEICVASPGVWGGNTYTEADKNRDLYYNERYLRTGDLGRVDGDNYLWITGRAKDLIIRGGHNIDPALIEEALLAHDAVAFAGAIGQPDPHSGEMPCAYVELVADASVTTDELMALCQDRVTERAALPKYIEVLDELPKTAVGKVFKPDLRKSAITRVFNAALADAGLDCHVVSVIDDKKRGLVAQISACSDQDAVAGVLGAFPTGWEWA